MMHFKFRRKFTPSQINRFQKKPDMPCCSPHHLRYRTFISGFRCTYALCIVHQLFWAMMYQCLPTILNRLLASLAMAPLVGSSEILAKGGHLTKVKFYQVPGPSACGELPCFSDLSKKLLKWHWNIRESLGKLLRISRVQQFAIHHSTQRKRGSSKVFEGAPFPTKI